MTKERNGRSLDDIATEIHKLERANIFGMGELLIEAKAKCEHGEWLDWIEAEFEWSPDTAENYMNAAELARKFRSVRNLKVPATTVYALASLEDELISDTIARLEVATKKGRVTAERGRREPSDHPKLGIAPKELAATVVRTLNLPEIATLRPQLTPEYTVFGNESDGRTETLISGIADAAARDVDDKIEVIVDWKSDVEMNAAKLAAYRIQLGDYRRHTGAKRALLVLMTEGKILNA